MDLTLYNWTKRMMQECPAEDCGGQAGMPCFGVTTTSTGYI